MGKKREKKINAEEEGEKELHRERETKLCEQLSHVHLI